MENPKELKSLLAAPIIILSMVGIFNILVFLFWIVEDVTDSENELYGYHAYYISQVIHQDSMDLVTHRDKLSQFISQHDDIINDKRLILTVCESDKILFISSPKRNLENYNRIYETGNLVWYYNRGDFFNRATYVIPYAFRKHATITWISLIILFASIWLSRIWINRNKKINQLLVLNAEWSRIGKITTGLLHEIRNPLNAVRINTQLIEEDILSMEIPEKEKNNTVNSLWSIQREIDHMDKLLDEFRDYSKEEDLKLLPINLNVILISAIEFYKGECQSKQIRIKSRFNQNLPKIKGDGLRIKQVIYNLINNAIQAMPEGGTLKISTFKSVDRIYINVTDSGTGISKEISHQIFDEFFSTKKSGTGLGLAIAKKIITLHNGEIRYRPNRKKGSTFSIIFKRQILNYI